MEKLSINKDGMNTQIPVVFMDSENSKGNILGESYHDGVSQIYSDIVDWINDYFKENDTFSLNFGLGYFNTPSSKGIYNILKCLKEWTDQNKLVSIFWYVSENDDDLLEDIEDLSDDVDIHISTIMTDKKSQIAS
ncbi:DUF1987 domain-containing protein [Flammeovirga pectinis]|uniref:DUF1987 domain-containing protein n=2 Tax=Flammeovirga pectinis TaxID=2494373 RepID=A0A3Q9FQ50_9BACT|nr:DUF1987 domain-containing protein [Flammeovirga pectinis]